MGEKEDYALHLLPQIKNIGYSAGLTFGIGYCLTLIGIVVVFVEIIVRSSGAFRYGVPQIPAWFVAALVFFFIGVICGIYFGFTVIKNSKTAKVSELSVDVISSSVNAFSFMLLFAGIGFAILAYGLKASLFSPICGVVGAILLFYGFRVFRSGVSEAKLIGAILMLVSAILTYFVAYRETGSYMAFVEIIAPVNAGPLFSEPTLEVTSLLIATICAIIWGVIFASPILGEGLKRNVAGVILSVSAILFSCGVMYFNFSAVSSIDKFTRYVIPGWLGYVKMTLNSIWIMFLGFLLLGVSGILILVSACISLAISAKQFSEQSKIQKLEKPVTPAAQVRYCIKCGTNIPADAVYCPKCGQKQP